MSLTTEERLHRLEITLRDQSEDRRHTVLVRLPEMEERVNKLIGTVLAKVEKLEELVGTLIVRIEKLELKC